jgi:hypothetical protein
MRRLDARLAALERHLPLRPPLPPEIKLALAAMSVAELRRAEQVALHWPEGQDIPLDVLRAIVADAEPTSTERTEPW